MKRKLELRVKAKEAVDRIFGDRKKNMIYGNLMGTDSLLAFAGELAVGF